MLPGRRAHVLEGDVDAAFVGDAPHFLTDVLMVVVDYLVGADLAGLGHLLFVARGANHAAVEELCDLHGGDADAAARADH